MKYGVVTGESLSRDGLTTEEPTRVPASGSVKLTPIVTGGGPSLDHPITLPLVEGRVSPRWVAVGEGLEYGFVALQDSSYCAVVGNTGDASADFGVKYNGSVGRGNTVSSNAWSPKKETNRGL